MSKVAKVNNWPFRVVGKVSKETLTMITTDDRPPSLKDQKLVLVKTTKPQFKLSGVSLAEIDRIADKAMSLRAQKNKMKNIPEAHM